MGDSDNHLHTIYAKAQKLTQKIEEKAENLKAILTDYQTEEVACYEIERCIRTLKGLEQNGAYLQNNNKKITSTAVMLPSNLPLYSLVVFGLIPSLLSQQNYVRPNSLLQELNIISRIADELELETLFPDVTILNTDHAGFKPYIKNADLVIFTGNPSNAENHIREMKEGSVLALNGSGHNPVVVTESADIEKAVEGTLLLKGFNGGQDCAGPDAILVHHNVAEEFIEKFVKRFSSLKTGSFKDPKTIIGAIHRLSELQKFAQIFHSNNKDIISGGIIDFKNSIVSPTTIVRGIERYPNYKEMFGPVAFIHPYKKDGDLSYYFQDVSGEYGAHRMYVTLYGKSDYVLSKDDSINPNYSDNIGIVLQDQTIHDVEIGYKPYGGYSLGASAIIKKTAQGLQKVAMPILLPEIISEYLIKNKDLPTQAKVKNVNESKPSASTKRDKEIEPVIELFKEIATQSFKDNLKFGFIFGSAAKGKLKVNGPDRDDLDTFICLNEDDPQAIHSYKILLASLHRKFNLKLDDAFPTEIITLKSLEETLDSLDKITIDIDKVVTGKEFDEIFWTHALTDKKVGFVGDGKKMSSLIKKGTPYIHTWRNQIIEQLEKKNSLPSHIQQKFSGLSKNDAIKKLQSHNPHLVVHLGLHYDDKQ